MTKVERIVKNYGLQFPWSPILVTAIPDFYIWKIIKSKLKTKASLANKQ